MAVVGWFVFPEHGRRIVEDHVLSMVHELQYPIISVIDS